MEKLKEENLLITPENEKMMSNKLRQDYGMAAYAILSLPKIKEKLKTSNVIIDGLYSWDELKVLQKEFENLDFLEYKENKKNYCIDCGKEVSKSTTKRC